MLAVGSAPLVCVAVRGASLVCHEVSTTARQRVGPHARRASYPNATHPLQRGGTDLMTRKQPNRNQQHTNGALPQGHISPLQGRSTLRSTLSLLRLRAFQN